VQPTDPRAKVVADVMPVPARPVDLTSRAPRPGARPRVRAAFLATVALAISTALVGFAGSAAAAPKPAPAKVPAVKVAAAKTPAHSKTPPVNPTNTQINNAAAAKSQAASDVGRLSGLIVGINGKIGHLNDVAELAGERYLQARWKLGLAQKAATKAQKAVVTAQKNFDNARGRFRLYIAAAYMNRSGDSSGLLTAKNPNILLERNDLGRYTSVRQLDAIGSMTRATVAKANAVSRARTAVALRTTLTGKANTARIVAGQAVASAKAQRVTLVSQRGRYEGQLTVAGEALTGLKNKRAAYLQWRKIEAQIKAAAARRARIARAKLLAAQAREHARLLRVEAQQAKDRRAREAAQRKAAAKQKSSNSSSHHTSSNSSASNNSSNSGSNNSGSNSSGSNNSGSNNSGSNDSGSNSGGNDNSGSGNGSWTPAKGRAAVKRAERWLGMPYSFAAGNANGPTYGVCSYSNACHVYGFDCSGLSLYAWAGSGIYLDHYTVSQYLGAGSVHPSIDELQPGDLTFWSTGGVSGIHHVAIYIGGGQVVEAPHTGDVVKITSLWMSGYYGATRPGT
jgi:cell wall-associated NlpC family hydrolase